MIRLDHVAVATREPKKLAYVLGLLGLSDHGEELVTSQGVMTYFHKPHQSESAVEILEPVDPQGVIAKYLDKKGPGIHHLCFLVDNVIQVCQKLSQGGVRLVYSEPRPGAHGASVNFIHPESTGGILIEVSQK